MTEPPIGRLGMPSRVQFELGLMLFSSLVMLWLYRSYLERSLEIERAASEEVLAERAREAAAAEFAKNGHVSITDDALEDLLGRLMARLQTTAPAPPAPPEPPETEIA